MGSIELISEAQTTQERFLRHIFVRDQMSEWSKHPLVMARADGAYYWDIEGKRYLDALSGIYVASVGHNNPRVNEAVRRQLDEIAFSPPMHGTNPRAIQLANLLAELAPGDLSVVKFASSGSEATEAAFKLARQYHRLRGEPGRYKIVSRYQAWHGSTMGSLAASGLKGRKTVNEPLPAGFLHVFPPTCYRCPFGKNHPDCQITCATLVGDVIDLEDPRTVAALIVEPIGHTGGIIDPPAEYLPILRDVADRTGALLIFDEIITGIGRTGRLFAAENFGVTPDILCIAKGLSGGYGPLSAVITTSSIASAFWGPIEENPGFVEGHTFEGHPLACAAAIAVLEEIVERGLLENARKQGERLQLGLGELARRHRVIGDRRGKGLLQGIELVDDPSTRRRFPDALALGVRVGREALHRGMLCRFDPHWIAFGPPLTVTSDQIDSLLDILDQSLTSVLKELPANAVG